MQVMFVFDMYSDDDIQMEFTEQSVFGQEKPIYVLNPETSPKKWNDIIEKFNNFYWDNYLDYMKILEADKSYIPIKEFSKFLYEYDEIENEQTLEKFINDCDCKCTCSHEITEDNTFKAYFDMDKENYDLLSNSDIFDRINNELLTKTMYSLKTLTLISMYCN